MRTRILLRSLPLLCCGALLLACSHPSTHLASEIVSVSQADDDYLRGRNFHLAQRYTDAIAAYEAALRTDDAHVNARNGLAIAYAEQREFGKAIPIWTALTQGATMSSGPAMAYLFANLGYAQFLNGDYEQASVALEKACLLNPLDEHAWQRLGETLQKLGQDARGQQMLRQASALRDHDLRADYAAAGQAVAPTLAKAMAAPAQADRPWAFIDVVRQPSGVLELRRVDNRLSAARAASASTQPDMQLAVALLEVSNGNGQPGIARLLSRQLHDPGVKVVRITNEKGFGVRQTRIEYRTAFRSVAERLAEYLGGGLPIALDGKQRTDMRIVIGHDLPSQKVAERTADVRSVHKDDTGML
jgi:tetratricopeptide (TPR) repeat protein